MAKPIFTNQYHNRLYVKSRIQRSRKSLSTYFIPVGILLLIIFFCTAILNTWYKSDTTKLAFQIEELKRERELLKDELTKLNIEVERLTSPEHIRKEIAPRFNLVLPDKKPVELKKK